MSEIIITTNLTKVYGKVHAVNNMNLSVKKGQIFGFLGLNGAGKTTTIAKLANRYVKAGKNIYGSYSNVKSVKITK